MIGQRSSSGSWADISSTPLKQGEIELLFKPYDRL
jgi:hypothetical protein